ncbi:putative reverse transcriptase domain-containing protein [Tanacetum coccineum]|uniref:Reverse transcriptase domain-containing protein n=1 Tax=Tanacetum coccineum TaxID=301880 RepID=A0ABQ5DW56_9ASTR
MAETTTVRIGEKFSGACWLLPTALDVVLCVEVLGKLASMRIESNLMLRSKMLYKDDGKLWAIVMSLREKVMMEAHSSPFTIHPGSTKMYRDLKQYFWWNGN